jgi:NADPH:quinone reductase-like Zn-dependent oxidoreductase
MRAGYARSLFSGWLPSLILGREFSGTVAAVGPGVRHIQPGSRVFGAVSPLLPRGSHARYVAVPAEDVAAVPAAWTDATAAALPFAALTAWRALRRAAPASLRGKTVLVLGAGGAVGSAAVQIAVAEGAAEVHASSGAHSCSRIAAYGASTVGDSAAALPDIATQLGWPRFDVVLDTRPSAGSGEQQALGLCAQHRGHYVTLHGKLVDTLDAYGLVLGLPQAAAHLLSRQSQVAATYDGVTYHWAAMRTDADAWAQLAGWAHEGLLAPHVGPAFAWDRAAAAHEAVESGRTSGRVVLTMTEEGGPAGADQLAADA